MTISIGIITRGKYGHRLIDNIKDIFPTVTTAALPQHLPVFIEDPAAFLSLSSSSSSSSFSSAINPAVFESDLVITYSLHPDLTPEIVRQCGKHGAKAVIIPGGRARAGLDAQKVGAEYGIEVVIEEICCALNTGNNAIINEFASHFGRPEFEVRIDKGKISSARVLRSSPCGATNFIAQNLVGIDIADAPARAGLLSSQYPCRAIRGTKTGIHSSGILHAEAVRAAIEKEMRNAESTK